MREEFRTTAFLILATGVSSLFRIAYVVYAGRVLGPAEYADFYAALAVVLVFAAGLAPVASAITRFLSVFRGRREVGKELALRRAVPALARRFACAVTALGLVFAWPLHAVLGFDSWWTTLAMVAILPTNLFVDIPRGILRGVHRFKQFGLSLLGESGLRLVLCVALLSGITSASTALTAYLLAAGATVWFGNRQCGRIQAGGDEEAFEPSELTTFMKPLFAFAFIGALYQNLDVLFVRGLFDAGDAGQYGAASALARVVRLILLPFSILILPVMATNFSEGRNTARPLLRILGGFLGGAIAVLLMYRLFAPNLLMLLYGARYSGASDLILPLTLAAVIASMSVLLGQTLAAMNRFRFLGLYGGGLLVQVALMLLASDSMHNLAYAVVLAQTITLAGLAAEVVHAHRT